MSILWAKLKKGAENDGRHAAAIYRTLAHRQSDRCRLFLQPTSRVARVRVGRKAFISAAAQVSLPRRSSQAARAGSCVRTLQPQRVRYSRGAAARAAFLLISPPILHRFTAPAAWGRATSRGLLAWLGKRPGSARSASSPPSTTFTAANIVTCSVHVHSGL